MLAHHDHGPRRSGGERQPSTSLGQGRLHGEKDFTRWGGGRGHPRARARSDWSFAHGRDGRGASVQCASSGALPG